VPHCGVLNDPERQAAGGGDEEEAVDPISEAQAERRQAQGHAPAFHGQQPLVEIRHRLHQGEVLVFLEAV
jgi:hypothetical protein